MLHRGIKFFWFFFFTLILYSCERKKITIKGQTDLYKKYSLNSIKENEYNRILKSAQDSIKVWAENQLAFYSVLKTDKWVIDTLLCFNKAKNRVVMARLVQCCEPDCKAEDIHFFYGVKIENAWYFFEGATIYLPRKSYQKDASKPLSFSKLHEIAMQEVFSGYLARKKKDAGFWKNIFAPEYEYEVNERFFDFENKNQSGEGYGSCLKCKTFEEYVLYLVGENWKKR